MKRIIITLLAFALSSITLAYAQGIHVGDTFYDGDVVYTVKEIRMGTVVYLTDVLGEEELTLEQWGSTPDVFRLRPSRNAEDPKYGAEFGCRVNFVSRPDNSYLEVIGDNDIVLRVLPLVKPMDSFEDGSFWHGDALVYTAHTFEEVSVLMKASAEGEEHEFVLTPITDGGDLYVVSDGPDEGVNQFGAAGYARRIRQGSLDVLCFYGKKDNLLMDALEATKVSDAQQLNVRKWMEMITGDYCTESGSQVKIWSDQGSYKGKDMHFAPVTFNGMVTGVLDFGSGGPFFVGKVEAVPTPGGLRMTEVKMNEGEPWYEKTVSSYELEWTGRESRFDFASRSLLNSGLRRLDKPTLRVMRNAILAAHGYVFKSKDLKAYFEDQLWYTPAQSNASVKLTLLEQLNVALIQAAERAQ